MIQNQKKIQKTNFIKELEGKPIEITSKFIDPEKFFIFKGTLIETNKKFIVLKNAVILKNEKGKLEFIKNVRNLIIHESIVGYINEAE